MPQNTGTPSSNTLSIEMRDGRAKDLKALQEELTTSSYISYYSKPCLRREQMSNQDKYPGDRPQLETPMRQHISYLQNVRERQSQYNDRLESLLARLEGPMASTAGKPGAPAPDPISIMTAMNRVVGDISELQSVTNNLIDRLDSLF